MQADKDLRAMIYKTAAVMPVDMVGAAENPLMLMAECLKGDMLLAVVREGATMVSCCFLCLGDKSCCSCYDQLSGTRKHAEAMLLWGDILYTTFESVNTTTFQQSLL